MRRHSLSTLLVAVNAALILLAVAGVAAGATWLLRDLADAQALGRVSDAGRSAQQVVRRGGQNLRVTARLLAERPTLLRLARAGDRPGMALFLEQFRRTGGLGATAVIVDGQAVAFGGQQLAWDALWAVRSDDGAPELVWPAADDPPLLVAWAQVPDQPDVAVLVARQLDDAYAGEVGAQVGLPVSFAPAPPAARTGDPRDRVRTLALANRAPAAARVDALGMFVGAAPLQLDAAQPVGVVEVRLATSDVDRSLRQLVAVLLLGALGVVALAGLASFLIGRELGRPLRVLARAAGGLGRGDLETPVPQARSVEVGTLAATLEETRWRLLQLTTDLRRQRAEAQAIVGGIVEGVFTVDESRRLRFLNRGGAVMLGVQPEDASGRFCGALLRPQGPDGPPCETSCPILRARGSASAQATERLLLPDGRLRTVVVTSAPPEEGVQVVVIRDETELESIRRMRDAVLADISHEFRTPLSAQLASIELLLERLPELNTEQIGQLVRSLQRGTMRLTQLIDNLLESVRIESGSHAVRRRPVALDEVVEEAVELTRPLLDQRRQEVALALPYPLPAVLGDAPRLTQVFVNLLSNANKFAPVGASIAIGGDVRGGCVELYVENTGHGVPANVGASLFDRFVRAAGDEPDERGLGLGLWIVKSIVERHGGVVRAQGAAGATRIYVTLPHIEGEEDGGRGR